MRFFYEENISAASMSLSPETARHVSQVLRMKMGDQFILTNGKGIRATVEVQNMSRKDCTVKVLDQETVHNPNPSIHLAIAFTKNNTRMEWLLEKITEIGVHSIYPLMAHRSEKKEFKAERFQKKLISAMLQSQQFHLPVLHEPISFNQLITLQQVQDNMGYRNKFIAHCEEDVQREPLALYQTAQHEGPALVVIGPEGDFTSDEIEQALQHNFKSISLGNNRLRTETAGLVAVTLLHHYAQ